MDELQEKIESMKLDQPKTAKMVLHDLFSSIAKKIWETSYNDSLIIFPDHDFFKVYFEILCMEMKKYIENGSFVIERGEFYGEIEFTMKQLAGTQLIKKSITCGDLELIKQLNLYRRRIQVFLCGYCPDSRDSWECRLPGNIDPRKCETFSISYLMDDTFAIDKFEPMKVILGDLKNHITQLEWMNRDEFFLPTIFAHYVSIYSRPCFFFNDTGNLVTFRKIFGEEYINIHAQGCSDTWYVSPDDILAVIKDQRPQFILIHLSGIEECNALKEMINRFMTSDIPNDVYSQEWVDVFIVFDRPSGLPTVIEKYSYVF